MVIVVVSPSKILAEALCGFIKTLGFEAHSNPLLQADIALHDLTTFCTFCAPPLRVPTLALTCPGDEKPVEMSYCGYLSADETGTAFKRALEALSRGERWLG